MNEFKITLADVKPFLDSLKVISGLINEARLKITPEGIKITQLDCANVCLVNWVYLPSGCVEYDVPKETQAIINIGELIKILKRIKADEILSLKNDEDKDKIKLIIKGQNTKEVRVCLLDDDCREDKMPDLTFTAEAVTNASTLKGDLEFLNEIGDSGTFKATKDLFEIKAQGDNNESKTIIKADDYNTISVTESQPIESKYSFEYLKKIIEGHRVCNKITLKFGKDYPLMVVFSLLDKVRLEFILAPRIEND